MGVIKAIKSKNIVTPSKMISGYLIIENGKISKVTKDGIPENFEGEILDVGNNFVLPGLIDLHIHGAGGWGAGYEDEQMAKFLAYNGVTSYYPTLGTVKKEKFIESLSSIESLITKKERKSSEKSISSEILGIHLEGPFLSKEEKGAMPEEYLLESSINIMEEFEKYSNNIARVTVAPEKKNSIELIKYLKKKGYIVAGGHTDSSYEEIEKGVDAGITVANHMYNAMRGLHHRRPGAVGGYLTDDRVICEIIGDLIHVHPAVIDLTLRAKGLENVYLISDAILAAGLPAGKYSFAGREITINKKGVSRLQDGTIAGSTMLLSKSIVNLIKSLDLAMTQIVKLASENPAKTAGVFDRKGSIAKGKDADLIVLDENYKLKYSFVKGNVVNKPDKKVKNLINSALDVSE